MPRHVGPGLKAEAAGSRFGALGVNAQADTTPRAAGLRPGAGAATMISGSIENLPANPPGSTASTRLMQGADYCSGH